MKKLLAIVAAAAAVSTVAAAPASATHSWGTYHWATASNPFTVGLDNNLTTVGWQQLGAASSSDWSASVVLDAALTGPKNDNKRCKASGGRVEVCNGKYGRNGWLGLAQIWLSGSHITQAVAKMNDTYLASSSYNDVNRQHVLCQEVGHTFGLGHQDESGADLDTCMDYARALDNPSPDAHDYEQLEVIYNHGGESSTLATTSASAKTGMAGRADARPYRTERQDHANHTVIVEHFADGSKRITDVLWADGPRPVVDRG